MGKSEVAEPLKAIPSEVNGKDAMIQGILQDVSANHRANILTFFDTTLNDYISDLARFSLELGQRPKDSEKIYSDFKASTDQILLEGETLTQAIGNRMISKRIKGCFRSTLADWFYNGGLTERAARKPRGYPGDFRTIDMFYDNIVKSDGMAGFWDRYVLSQGYVQGVRDRKDHMKGLLKNYLVKNRTRGLKILNIGSGSCRELRETPKDVLETKKELCITLLDQDQSSLTFSKKELKRTHPRTNFRFIKANVLSYARHADEYEQKLGKQDLIYSIGLADYIPDEFLGGMLATSFVLLKPKGAIIVAHKNLFLHKSLASDWFCDWTFIPRTEEEFQNMANQYLKPHKYKMKLEQVEDRHIYFLTIEKG